MVCSCSFPDMEASWIPTPKLSRLLSPRRQPSTTLSSMQSFTTNIGEAGRPPQQPPQLRKRDVQIAEIWLFPTGTRWQRKFPVCTSCPRRPGGSASRCPRVSPPSGTPCWADTRQGSTGWCPCLRQTRSVPVLTLPPTQYWCHRCLFGEYFGSREAAEQVLFLQMMRLIFTCSTSGVTWSWTPSATPGRPVTHWELWRTKNICRWRRYQRRREAKARNGYGQVWYQQPRWSVFKAKFCSWLTS